MPHCERDEWLGSGLITPDGAVTAGDTGTWTVTYTVGVSGVDDGGAIRLAYHTVSDWAGPQFNDPAGANYLRVQASRPVRITSVSGADGIRPMTHTMTFRVSEGALAHGDRVVITLGDRIAGGCGMRAQTFAAPRFYFTLQVNPFGTGLYKDVTDLHLPIVGGSVDQLVAVAPSDVTVNEASWLQVRALDRWGNVDASYRGRISFAGDVPDGLPATYEFNDSDAGIHRFDGVRHDRVGLLRVNVQDESSHLASTSNPIRCNEEPSSHRLFWGDLHGQTEETVGFGTIPEYFTYARDVSALDVTAHSGNDFQITNETYQELHENAEAFYKPGRFVTFHGYEWSGNSPAGGDHNVYYLGDGPLRRSSHEQVNDKSDVDSDCYPIPELYAANADNSDVLITPHIGGRRANLEFHDPDLEPAIEIASQWGRFEWFAHEALERGMKVGFIGGSDDHSGRPGWSAPTLSHHGVHGGLTAFLATDLTREAIWDALRARRCYGTSGPRIILDMSVDDHPIGSEFVASGQPLVRAKVIGTAPIDTVELRRGSETVHTHSALPPLAPDEPWRLRIAWRGARNRGRTRALDWTGGLHVWGGRILAVENHAIDNPLDGVIDWSSDHIAWRSHTCGDWDGVVVDLEGDADTVLDFESPTMTFRFALNDVGHDPLQFEGVGLEQQVAIRRLSRREAPMEASFEWRDISPAPGVNPYWLWVTQADGELAWSSPIFANVNDKV